MEHIAGVRPGDRTPIRAPNDPAVKRPPGAPTWPIGEYPGVGRRNLLKWSEELTHVGTWSAVNNCSFMLNEILAPDGTMTADYAESIGSDYSGFFYCEVGTPTVAADGPLAMSVFFKKGLTAGGTLKFIHPYGEAAYGHWTVDCTLIGDGWERLSATHPAVTVVVPFRKMDGAADGFLVSGENAGSWRDGYFWGAQMESGTSVTQYQKMTDGTVFV